MNYPNSDPDLLKSLLEPLLEDFRYWFEQSQQLLEMNDISFLTAEAQADLLARVITAQQEVGTAQMLLKLTAGQVGVETAVIAPWHHLVQECWQVSRRLRQGQLSE